MINRNDIFIVSMLWRSPLYINIKKRVIPAGIAGIQMPGTDGNVEVISKSCYKGC
jgi:hypothetical protein